jgi:calcineurin-like phosphoesterase family protein
MKLQQNDFFTSDTHWQHTNVLAHCSRPFPDIDTHDAFLVDQWNNRVQKGDRVFHLGDVSLGKDPGRTVAILKALHGEKHLVWGNHDHWARKSGKANKTIHTCFVSVQPEMHARLADGTPVCMYHYPQVTWKQSHYGAWCLHGHCHGSLWGLAITPAGRTARHYYDGRVVDVGVDARHLWGFPNYEPWSLADLEWVMARSSFVQVDHHASR